MAELGRAVFRGYRKFLTLYIPPLTLSRLFVTVISSQNLVGRWRHVAFPDWESIFSLCKERET